MFTHECSACHRNQLISLTMATSVAKVDDGGLRVDFTCWCGAAQTHTLAALGRQDVLAAV